MPFGSVFRINFNGLIRMLIARKIVCFLSITSRALTTQVLSPPSVTYYTIGLPTVCTLVLPFGCREVARKRVVFHSLVPSLPFPFPFPIAQTSIVSQHFSIVSSGIRLISFLTN
jgi:hypothetical protein